MSAHFGIEHRLIGDDEQGVLLRMDFQDGGGDFVQLEAEKLSARIRGNIQRSNNRGFLRGTGTFLLLLHELIKTRHVHREAALGAQQLG